MEFIEFSFNSELYKKSVKLRDEILRKPLGLKFTDEFLKQDEENFHLGVIENDKLIATLSLAPYGDFVKMRQVAVSSELQGKSIGSKLVEFSEKFSKEKGFKKIKLHAREVAKSFYLRNGYSVCSEVFYEVGIPHYKMEKEL